jgi:hypothetical protein
MRYLKDDYLHPVARKELFHSLFVNSYGTKPNKKKIIIKGLTLLDAMIDLKGEYIPGKQTLIICSNNVNLLYLLAAIINSRLAYFYISQRYSSSSYNGGINFTKEMINNLPLPDIKNQDKRDDTIYKEIISNVKSICKGTFKGNFETAQNRIDNLIYPFYHLSSDEIAIVENYCSKNLK